MAAERLDEKSHEKVMGLLRAGDPRGEVTACYNANRKPFVSSTASRTTNSPECSSTS
jgi:hypothetical protein